MHRTYLELLPDRQLPTVKLSRGYIEIIHVTHQLPEHAPQALPFLRAPSASWDPLSWVTAQFVTYARTYVLQAVSPSIVFLALVAASLLLFLLW